MLIHVLICVKSVTIFKLYYTSLMKLLGIDYGTKRVGIASTDESGTFAIPRMVIPNTDDLASRVIEYVNENEIEKIILGESKNLDGKANAILPEIYEFADALRKEGKEVILHAEFFTSMEAERLQGKNEMLDASAAAIILKSYIDTELSK